MLPFRFVNYQFLNAIFCDQIMVLLVILYIVSYIFSENEEASVYVCPYTDKQRLIKIPLKCLKAFLAPAFIKIPALLFFILRNTYITILFDVRYILKWWYITKDFLGLVFILSISFSHPSPPFLCSSSFSSTHKTISHVGLMMMMKKIIRTTGCSIGRNIPCMEG